MESVMFSVIHKKFVNRGFLIGPICPIYGYGVVVISVLLKNFQENFLITFFASIIISGVLEYFTSYFMEKIFKARWWDYSKKKFNINGRVCLKNLILFGLASLVIVHISNPMFIRFINSIPKLVQSILSIILVIVYLIDNIVSFRLILNLKKVSDEIKDDTIEISEKIRKIIENKSTLYRRLVEAFPNIRDRVRYNKWIIREKIKDKKRK